MALLSLAALVKEKALSASAPQHSALQGYKKQLKAITLTFLSTFFCCPLKMCVCGIMKVLYFLEVFVMIVQLAGNFLNVCLSHQFFLRNVCSIKFPSKQSTVLLLYLLQNLMRKTLFVIYIVPKQNSLKSILSFC